jgi:hypothetical protein
MPAAAVPALPALHRDGVLAAVPALAYPAAACANGMIFRFQPVGGAAT